MNPKEQIYSRDGKPFVKSGEFRVPISGETYLSAGGAVLLRLDSSGYPKDGYWDRDGGKRHILIPHSDGLTRVQGEVVATPPLRRIDVESVKGHQTPSATVGFSRKANGDEPRVRLELTKRFVQINGIQDHKDRNVVAPNMIPEVARRIGRALIEAADAAESGNYEFSKRS